MKKIALTTLTAAALFATAAPAADASTASTTFLVSLTITASCTISANPLAFGSSAGLSTAINQTTTLSVTCTDTTPYNVGLDAGTVSGSSAVAGGRLLAGTTSGNSTTIPFSLYSDSGYSVNWGNTVGTNTVTGTGTGSAQTLTVYGQVPAMTTQPTPDLYETTITATVTY